MEFTKEDFYEGQSEERLEKIISVINLVFQKYGGYRFKDMLMDLNSIKAAITWSGYDNLNADNAAQTLQNITKLLIKSQSIISEEDYQKIEKIIEPLEIVITELKLGYCD